MDPVNALGLLASAFGRLQSIETWHASTMPKKGIPALDTKAAGAMPWYRQGMVCIIRPLCAVLGLALLIAPAPSPAVAQAGSGSALHLMPCVEGRTRVSAYCGTFRVYENRTAHAGRTIVLHLIVLHAKHRGHRAIYVNLGGPGAPTLPAAAGLTDGAFLKELAVLRDRYDIILLDNRGMGASHPLNCDLAPPAHPAVYLRQLWPSALLSACHARRAAQSDLRQYTTVNAADDLDELRAALGYPKMVLDGGSYGTYFSLVYAQRHPAHVESLVLQGVVPPRLPETFIGFAPAAQAALDKLAAECEADASCHAHFPQFRAHFAALAARLNREPIPVLVRNGATKRVVTVALSKQVFVDTVRHVLYDIGAAAYVPYVVEQEYRGNTLPLGTLIDDTVQGFAQGLDDGALLSYSCAEYVPFVTETEIRASSAGTFMGDTRVRAQQQACKIWSVPPGPSSVAQPIRIGAPVLMISGTNDPATPPAYSSEQLRYLPNAGRVLVRGASHVTQTACTDRLIVAFVLQRSAKGLPLNSCSAAFSRPPFATSSAGLP